MRTTLELVQLHSQEIHYVIMKIEQDKIAIALSTGGSLWRTKILHSITRVLT
ncbi:MAG: hypothetical protein F6K41_44295 [Symploca sp. SIO3E6]|nr:hypothetical protein [Caldora sp. SIO3E6]